MSISAFIPVFNEEKRIKYALTSLQWCDEIIVLDKTSTDKTVQIAKEFGAKVHIMPNSDAYNVQEFDYFKYCSSEWIIVFTASDILDVALANEITKLITSDNFDYDVLKIPYKRYILGINHKRSPWHGDFHPSIFRKSILKVKKEEVHSAISFESKKILTIDYLNNAALHHLTHQTVDIMMDRHIRYWRTEGANFGEPTLKKPGKDVLRGIKRILWDKKTWLLGWEGVALMCAFMSYVMMSFVYKWEKKNSNAVETYSKIREQMNKDWEINKFK